MNNAIVRMEQASKAFDSPEGGKVHALRSVNLEVRRNEFLTLLGPSGCGKTTLLQSINGFAELDGGAVHIDGEDVTKVPPYRRKVNTVFQNYALFPHMTIGQNVGYALEVEGVGKSQRLKRIADVLALVGLSGLEDRGPRQISGGQQQRVALARAIIARPKLLLLDEPLSALDKNLRHSMQIELKTLQSELGISFIFVTHDQQEALTMSDRIAVLQGGIIQQLDAPRAIYDRPDTIFVANFIGTSNLFEGSIDGAAIKLADGSAVAFDGACSPQENGRATALIRPENFSLVGSSRFSGALDIIREQVVFAGSSFEILGRTPSGRKVTATVPGSERARIPAIEENSAVTLHYDPATVHLIYDTASQGGRA
ncbi:ABC transporter ATP-binding protein [Rhizobium sp. KVB221]|uniref:ABC transporter ATP-binding protein n=1 Tax=Rhizobium setariae TaxID=2801340 RepID=A0A936YNL8_9HYPH|nr:ABC transporter ATP-binding protein [Rhizobium setariae]MBL0371434.1 ABC transporter ATP-binding protein [Rhizobium setariae]